ncbi:MAG: glycerophosphodiester phosphodiesterase family protein [Candidatus Berkiellales bacterium]
MKENHFTPIRPKSGIIGHRGVAALAPENTLASFQLAAKQGIDWVEFDLRLTKDDQLVIFHDDSLQRTTNGEGFVHEKTLNELIALDAGSWFHPDYHAEKIPHFNEIFPELLMMNLTLNLELKLPSNPTLEHVQGFARSLTELLQIHWPKDLNLPLISSFHWPILFLLRNLTPTLPLGFLTKTCTESVLQEIAEIPNSACHTHFQSLTPELLLLANEYDVPVLTYTVNDPETAIRLLEQGVFAVFSDDPLQILRHMLKRHDNMPDSLKK